MLRQTLVGISLENPLMNASGCWCQTETELDQLVSSDAGMIVSKSGTINSREGNPHPRLYLDKFGSINSMGLPNLGYEFYTDYGLKCTKPFIQSLFPFNMEEFDQMIEQIFEKVNSVKLIELNISCPNLIGRSTGGFEQYEQYMDRIKQMGQLGENMKIGFKLKPLFEQTHYDVMANLLLKYSVPFITTINSLPDGLIVDPITLTTKIYPKDGVGGIGGQYVKPISLSNAYNFSKRLDNMVDVVGCGGISTGIDCFEYILCGCKCVQIGTQLMREGVDCFGRIRQELIDHMNFHKYQSLDDFYKKIKVINMYDD
jgi:dihydroorotate dehydrogenase (fumarate)